jgi:cell division protein FtsQ
VSFVDERMSSRSDEDTERRGGKRRRFRPFAALRTRRRRIADRWLAREHRRRRLYIFVVGLAVLLIAGGVWVVWFSSWLGVDEVRVGGLSQEASGVGALEVETAAAIERGTPLVSVDTAASQDRVTQLPWVESAEVFRSWPNAIVVNVVERTPMAVVEDGEARSGVDVAGVLFDPPGGLWLTGPIIRGNEVAVPEAVAVVASLPEEIERRVRVVQAVSPDDIRLQLGNDSIVRWGNADEADFKAQVLLALLPRRAEAYDVSAPQLPTTFGERGSRD